MISRAERLKTLIDDVLKLEAPFQALAIAESMELLLAELEEQVRANEMLLVDRDHWKTCAKMEFEIRSEIAKENFNLKQGSKEVFMCGIDFHHELGEAMGGNSVYPDIEDLKENHKCWEECGIVRVAVSLVSEVVPSRI